MGFEGEVEGAGENLDEIDAPPSYAEGEKLCPCPEEKEPVELDLDLNAIRTALEEEEITELDKVPHETMALDLPASDEESLPLEEDIEISDDLIEKLIVDMSPQMNGWAGRPEAELEFEKDLDLARMQSTEYKEENEELKENLNKIKKEKQELKSNVKEHRDVLMMLKEKLEELTSSNARLLYSNKVLSSASLNERQKKRIVEAISNTDTIEEAKVLYETLQSAVGSSPSKRREPKSLNEAVERRNSMLRARRQKVDESNLSNPVRDRMRKLAGLK